LGKEFPFDLLDEIKVMVMITLQHNSANLKSSFLLDFLWAMMELPRNRTLMSERITTILDEIANRYDSDIILSRNTMKLIDIMRISKIYHEELINKIEKGMFRKLISLGIQQEK